MQCRKDEVQHKEASQSPQCPPSTRHMHTEYLRSYQSRFWYCPICLMLISTIYRHRVRGGRSRAKTLALSALKTHQQTKLSSTEKLHPGSPCSRAPALKSTLPLCGSPDFSPEPCPLLLAPRTAPLACPPARPLNAQPGSHTQVNKQPCSDPAFPQTRGRF